MQKRNVFIKLTVFSVLVGVVVLLGIKRQAISDWIILRDYMPSERVSSLAVDTTMTDAGRHLFYVYDPQIASRDAFNNACRSHGESTIVLGCYNSKNIYVYDVADPRLEGILQVTSAHEMLHAAYERLSSEERKRVDNLTSLELAKIKDERILSLVKQYKDKDAASVPNELHSILGTEVRNLGKDLEQHYAKYFSNRAQVVSYSEKYENVFTGLQNQIASQKEQIAEVKKTVESLESELRVDKLALDADRAQLDKLLSDGNVADYNKSVPKYNAKVVQFNSKVALYQQEITEHNKLVEALQANILIQQDLVSKIDSNFQTLTN